VAEEEEEGDFEADLFFRPRDKDEPFLRCLRLTLT
jgi:hypothetical protein